MDLKAAYYATAYHVDGPAGRFALRLGAHSPEADSLLTHFQATAWTFVTAHNPRSQKLSRIDNDLRHEQLVAEVASRGVLYWPGLGVGDDGTWPPEVSLFILGLSEPDALLLGRQFGQNAVVCGDHGGVARLCWIWPQHRLPVVFPGRRPD